MGQTLSEPITTKDTATVGNSTYKVASSSMQGWRVNMEDYHTNILSMKEDKDAAFFAVFDGHGGAKVAQYSGENLHKRIVGESSYAAGKVEDAMRTGFLECDKDMQNDDVLGEEMAGSTAITVLIKNKTIYCGNVGDSRAVACVHGAVEELSHDHKPSNEEEKRRIYAAGGWVEFNRVNGNLALSRAMGDFIFKRNNSKTPEHQIVTAYPDVITKELTDDHEFILLACDGIWDVMNNEEVVDFIRSRIAEKMSPEEICEELLSHCLAPDCQLGGLGCDNMTVVLVCLLQDSTYDDLALRCSRPPINTESNHTENETTDNDLT